MMTDLKVNSTIVVPWDFSRHAAAALKYALQRFAPDRIRIVCVLEKPNLYTPGVFWGEEAETKARTSCESEFAASFDLSPYPEAKFDAVFGDAADEIVQYVNNLDDVLIVISTHGRSGVKKLLMGSVAEQILKQANCPLIMLPNAWFEAHAEPVEEVEQTES